MALTASWFSPPRYFLSSIEHDVERGAVVVGAEDLALVADQQRAAARELAAHLDDLLGEVGARAQGARPLSSGLPSYHQNFSGGRPSRSGNS